MKASHALKRLLIGALLFGLPTLYLTACAKKQTVKKVEEETEKDEDGEVESAELDVHGMEFVPSKNLEAIHFDYDSSELKDEARQILAKNSEYLKGNSDLEVLVEGHTDERGTVGYNLALGQKRSQSVRKYYISLGLDPKRLGSLSYGKEKPICIESAEECWRENRRVETKVRALQAAGDGKDKGRQPEEESR